MSLKEEKRIMQLIAVYLKTFPPYSKNGNNIIGKIKRYILMVIIRIVIRDDVTKLEEAVNRFEQRYYLTK